MEKALVFLIFSPSGILYCSWELCFACTACSQQRSLFPFMLAFEDVMPAEECIRFNTRYACSVHRARIGIKYPWILIRSLVYPGHASERFVNCTWRRGRVRYKCTSDRSTVFADRSFVIIRLIIRTMYGRCSWVIDCVLPHSIIYGHAEMMRSYCIQQFDLTRMVLQAFEKSQTDFDCCGDAAILSQRSKDWRDLIEEGLQAPHPAIA